MPNEIITKKILELFQEEKDATPPTLSDDIRQKILAAINSLNESEPIRREEEKEAQFTPSMYAIQKNEAGILQKLLDAGENPNAFFYDSKDQGHYTVLMLAVKQNNLAMVKSIIKAGAEVDQSVAAKFGKRTALSYALLETSIPNPEMINTLIEAGANPISHRSYYPCCTTRRSSESLINLAAFTGRFWFLDNFMMKNSCEMTDPIKRNIWIFAAKGNQIKLLNELLFSKRIFVDELGLNQAKFKTQALGCLIHERIKNLDVINLLVENGANINEEYLEKTPLLHAFDNFAEGDLSSNRKELEILETVIDAHKPKGFVLIKADPKSKTLKLVPDDKESFSPAQIEKAQQEFATFLGTFVDGIITRILTPTSLIRVRFTPSSLMMGLNMLLLKYNAEIIDLAKIRAFVKTPPDASIFSFARVLNNKLEQEIKTTQVLRYLKINKGKTFKDRLSNLDQLHELYQLRFFRLSHEATNIPSSVINIVAEYCDNENELLQFAEIDNPTLSVKQLAKKLKGVMKEEQAEIKKVEEAAQRMEIDKANVQYSLAFFNEILSPKLKDKFQIAAHCFAYAPTI